MKTKILILGSGPKLFTSFDGEKNVEDLLAGLGVSKDDIEAFKKGEKESSEIVNAFVTQTEKNVEKRIKPTIESELKQVLYAGVWNKAEKMLIDKSGGKLKLENYEKIEKHKRYETMLADYNKLKDDEIAELNGQVKSGVNGEKFDQIKTQLAEANATIDKIKLEGDSRVEIEVSKHKNYVKNQVVKGKINALIEGLENSRLDPQTIRDIVTSTINNNGYELEVEETTGQNGEVVNIVNVTKEGNFVKNPTKPTENLTLGSMFGNLSEKRQFVAKSNGGSGSTTELGDETLGDEPELKNVHPAFMKQFNED